MVVPLLSNRIASPTVTHEARKKETEIFRQRDTLKPSEKCQERSRSSRQYNGNLFPNHAVANLRLLHYQYNRQKAIRLSVPKITTLGLKFPWVDKNDKKLIITSLA